MKKPFLTGCFCAILGSIFSSTIGAEPDPEEKFSIVLKSLRNDWASIKEKGKTKTPEKVAEIRKRLGRPILAEKGEGSKNLEFLQSAVKGLSRYLLHHLSWKTRPGFPSTAEIKAVYQLPTAVLVHGLYMLRFTTKGKKELRRRYDTSLGRLLPIGYWGRIPDVNEIFALTNPGPPKVPKTSMKKEYAEIAKSLHSAGEYDMAWRAYVEAAEVNSKGVMTATWTAQFFFDAAKSTWLAGRKEIAVGFLLSSGVFGDEELSKQVVATWKEWTAAKKPMKTVSEVRKKNLSRAVALYAGINAHPRGLAIVLKFPNDILDRKKQTDRIQDEWGEIIRTVGRGSSKLTLWGVKIRPHPPSSQQVKIPLAFSDEAIRTVRKTGKEWESTSKGTGNPR